MTEEEILKKYSTPGLRKNQLTRSSKKLYMSFDPTFSSASKEERDQFLDKYFPSEGEEP